MSFSIEQVSGVASTFEHAEQSLLDFYYGCIGWSSVKFSKSSVLIQCIKTWLKTIVYYKQF